MSDRTVLVRQTEVTTKAGTHARSRSVLGHGDAGHLLHKHLRHLPGHFLLHLLVVLAADQLLDSFTDPETDSLSSEAVTVSL